MPAALKIDGLAELLQELIALPKTLGTKGNPIVVTHATDAERKIRDAYPRRTGKLADAMDLEITAQEAATHAVVINRSPLAEIYEEGTQARHTAIGANRGAAPPGHVFIPIAQRERQQMLVELIQVVEGEGLRVTNDPT